jgi:hypothetical protein
VVVRGAASCPYCASALKPPPVASGRCPRCRQRIIVKRIAGRPVYLTEAAVPVFEAERRRTAHAGRWTHERDRWLEQARAAGAEADRVARLVRLPVSEDIVDGARRLYLGAVDRAVAAARRERRWDDGARLRFDEALTVRRLAGPRSLPSVEVLRLHRDGLALLLRGIGELARSAELLAGSCCDTCRSDDGLVVRIADELRAPHLPHAQCPKGLCRCRWLLPEHERAIVADRLRRQGRPARRHLVPVAPGQGVSKVSKAGR